LGSKVTAITDISELLPRADSDVSQTLENIFIENGVEFHKNSPVQKISNTGDTVEVHLSGGEKFHAEYAFVAIGRKPDISKLHLENTDVKYSESNGIQIDKTCRTNAQNIYAIGDVTGPPMLANRASAMGRIAAWNVVNNQEKVFKNKYAVEVVYTEPEVGQVGLNERKAQETNVQYSIRKAEYKNNLKASITEHREGFLKLIIEDHTEKVLGASAVGYHAGDLLAPIAVAVKSGLCLDELLQIAPANPTLSELIIAGE
jgi:dihydrolipoamide dehydrogenase